MDEVNKQIKNITTYGKFVIYAGHVLGLLW
jgi:hypothetical protein